MKRILCIFAVVFAFYAVSPTASALDASTDAPLPQGQKEQIDAYLEDFSDKLPEGMTLPLSDSDAMEEAVGVHGLFSAIGAVLAAEREELLSFALTLLGMTLLLALVGALSNGEEEGILGAALTAVLSVALVEQLVTTVRSVADSLHAATAFFGSLLPLFTAVTAAAGGEGTAAAEALGMSLTVELLQTALSELLLPLGGLLLALGLVGMLGEGGGAQALSEQLRRIFAWGIGLLSALIAAAVSLQTVLASASDSLALRTARYTLSSMLPTVGGTVAGALSTLLGGLSYVKSTVGVGVIFVLLSMLLPPLVRLLLYRFLLSGAGSFMRFASGGCPCAAPDTLRAALDIYIALLSVSGVLMILETVLFIKCGAALV